MADLVLEGKDPRRILDVLQLAVAQIVLDHHVHRPPGRYCAQQLAHRRKQPLPPPPAALRSARNASLSRHTAATPGCGRSRLPQGRGPVYDSTMTNDPAGLYARLGVDPSASAEAIHAAFRRKARVLHPDIPQTGNAEAFDGIDDAFHLASGL